VKFSPLFTMFFLFTSLAWGTDWYRTNSLGTPIEEIPSYRIEEYEYTLSREPRGGGYEEKFYHQGELVRSLIRVEGRESTERTYDPLGNLKNVRGYLNNRLLYEEHYFQETLQKREDYTYNSQNMVAGIRTTNGTANIVEDKRYLYLPNGRLYKVVRVQGESQQFASFVYDGEGKVLADYDKELEEFIFIYGQKGIESYWQLNENQKVLLKEFFTYNDRGGITHKKQEFKSGLVREYTYENSLLVRAEERQEGQWLNTTQFFYDDELLIQQDYRDKSLRKRWVYEYQEDTLYMTSYYENFILKWDKKYFSDKVLQRWYEGSQIILEKEVDIEK